MPTQTPPQPAEATVLLVDDDVDTRRMYQFALELHGYAVVDAPSASDAMTAAIERRPDVIVTDLGMPGSSDGLGLARGLREHPQTARIPVLAVTGRDPRSLGEAAALFDAVLLKPVTPDSLVSRIQQSLLHSSGRPTDEQ